MDYIPVILASFVLIALCYLVVISLIGNYRRDYNEKELSSKSPGQDPSPNTELK